MKRQTLNQKYLEQNKITDASLQILRKNPNNRSTIISIKA